MKYQSTKKMCLSSAGKNIFISFLVLGVVFSGTASAQTNTTITGQQIGGAAQRAVNRAATDAVKSSINSAKPTSQDIAGKCVAKVMETKVTAYATGIAIGAIGMGGKVFSAGIGVPSSDFGSGLGSILQSAEGAASTVTSWMEPLRECMVHQAKQLLIDQINIAATAAIREGLNGDPNFNVNLNRFLGDLSSMASKEVRYQLKNIDVCDFTGDGSYKDTLTRSIGSGGQQTARQNFQKKVECPFGADKAVQTTASDFYNNFRSGGWRAYEASLSDNGNPFGVALMTAQEEAKRDEELRRSFELTLAQGSGFLPVVDTASCDYPPGLEDFLRNEADIYTKTTMQRQYCKILTPAKTVADTASKAANSATDRLNAPGGDMEGFKGVEEAMGTMVNGMF